MKKIIILLITLFTLCSCYEKDHITTIKYKIYYPGNYSVKTYTFESSDNPSYLLGSDRGTNYLKVFEDGSWPGHGLQRLECTSAPIEIVSFTKRKK